MHIAIVNYRSGNLHSALKSFEAAASEFKNVNVKITDAAGNLVYKTTSNGGTAAWNCRALNGQRVASGVYYIWTATNVGNDKKVGKVLIMN